MGTGYRQKKMHRQFLFCTCMCLFLHLFMPYISVTTISMRQNKRKKNILHLGLIQCGFNEGQVKVIDFQKTNSKYLRQTSKKMNQFFQLNHIGINTQRLTQIYHSLEQNDKRDYSLHLCFKISLIYSVIYLTNMN